MPFEPDDLELVFQVHVIELVTRADLTTTRSEQAIVDRWFPKEILLGRGFVDSGGARTARFAQAVAEALATLPARLDQRRKLELLDVCYRVAVADRELRIGEGTVLLTASRELGLSDEVFDTFLLERPSTTGMSAALLSRWMSED